MGEDSNLKSHDAFICVVMSPGGAGDVIYGADGAEVSVNDVTKALNDGHCVGLRDKPKVFFFHLFWTPTSLSESNDEVVGRHGNANNYVLGAIAADGPAALAGLLAQMVASSTENGPSWQDMILVYSFSQQNSLNDQSSVFIEALTTRLAKHCRTDDLEKILELVSKDMRQQTLSATGQPVALPVIEKRAFVKYLYFNF